MDIIAYDQLKNKLLLQTSEIITWIQQIPSYRISSYVIYPETTDSKVK